MISEKIGIDDIDCKIMDLIQKEPTLTHTEIAGHVNRSQPTIGMRIRRLEKIGILKSKKVGTTNLYLNIKLYELLSY